MSITTRVPKPGGQIFEGDQAIDYSFMGTDPNAPDNRWLREAATHQIPIIYFVGISPGRYQAELPTYIMGWDSAHAAFDAHLIGIDQDYRLHVSKRLLEQKDGPMLEALKNLDGGKIHLPRREVDLPDQDRLKFRFELFKHVA